MTGGKKYNGLFSDKPINMIIDPLQLCSSPFETAIAGSRRGRHNERRRAMTGWFNDLILDREWNLYNIHFQYQPFMCALELLIAVLF
jgi:hypothetical protein